MEKNAKEKRIQRAYKIRKSVYEKAKKRADKDVMPLAGYIEYWVSLYADGHSLKIR